MEPSNIYNYLPQALLPLQITTSSATSDLQKRSMRFYGISTIPGFSLQHFNRSATFYVKNILIRGVYVEVGGYLNQHHC